MKKYNKIAIDISNFYSRAYFASPELTSIILPDGFELVTGGIIRTLKMLQRVEREFLDLDGEIYFLFDNCHSGINKRKDIDPDYKSNRTPREETFYRSLDYLHLILMSYKDNYFTVKKQGYEADDLVESFAQKFISDNILLVTNDFDWFRAISETVHVAKYEQNIKNYFIYKPSDFEEKFGFPPTNTKMCLYKSFRGDKGDNVPNGCPGIRTKDLIRLVEDYDSIKQIYLDVQNIEYLSPTFKKKIIENRSRLIMNYKLVGYLSISIPELEESVFDCSFKPKTLLNLYKSLQLEPKEIDPRVYQYFIRKEKKPSSFFKPKKIPRV